MNYHEKIAELAPLNPDVVFEVGCDALIESTPMLRRVFPNAQFYCFDPDPLHRSKVEQSGADKTLNVNWYPIAMGAQRGEMEIWLSTHGLCSSMKKPKFLGLESDPFRFLEAPVKVEVDTIDDFCDHHDIMGIGLLFMDVQSGEDVVLQGAHRMVKFTKYIALEHNTDGLYESSVSFHTLQASLPDFEAIFVGPYDAIFRNMKYG